MTRTPVQEPIELGFDLADRHHQTVWPDLSVVPAVPHPKRALEQLLELDQPTDGALARVELDQITDPAKDVRDARLTSRLGKYARSSYPIQPSRTIVPL